MRERLEGFYKKYIRPKETKVRTVLGQTTAESVASQLEGSKPVNLEDLIGKRPEGEKPSRIDERGEIVDDQQK